MNGAIDPNVVTIVQIAGAFGVSALALWLTPSLGHRYQRRRFIDEQRLAAASRLLAAANAQQVEAVRAYGDRTNGDEPNVERLMGSWSELLGADALVQVVATERVRLASRELIDACRDLISPDGTAARDVSRPEFKRRMEITVEAKRHFADVARSTLGGV